MLSNDGWQCCDAAWTASTGWRSRWRRGRSGRKLVTASSIYKTLLTVNVASLIRASRFGVRDVAKRLRKSYKTISPFGTIDSGLEPEPLIPCIVGNYCKGHGLEIGPGGNPRCDPERTVLLDKFPGRYGPVKVDIVSDAVPFPSTIVPSTIFSLPTAWNTCRTQSAPSRSGCESIKPGGRLILMLPHAGRTWERQRSLSTLEHHIHDHANKVDLYDFTDWDEFEDAPFAWASNLGSTNQTHNFPTGRSTRDGR